MQASESQGTSVSQWTCMHLDDPNREYHDILAACYRQIQYLKRWRRAWATPQAPRCWIERSEYAEHVDVAWTYQTDLASMYLNIVKQDLSFVGDDVIDERSPMEVDPNFCLSCPRHRSDSEVRLRVHQKKFKTKATLSQVTNFLQYRGGGLAAEYAVTTALDGIPGTYVRRSDLRMQQPGGIDAEASYIDSAVLFVPFGPSTETSVDNLLHLPISTLNPALVLCAKGPAEWADESGSSRDLSSTLCAMAEMATPSLASLTINWQLRRLERERADDPIGNVSDHAGQDQLPEWAVLIGIIYDSEVIHFVAHIPVTSDGGQQCNYLSVLFETLPFPEECRENVAEFVLNRYRVAYAMLCIQHHIFRLTSLGEDTGALPGNEDAYDALWAQLVTKSVDYTTEMPDPSHTSCDSAPYPLDFIIDEPEHGSNTLEAHAREIERVLPVVEKWRNTIEAGDCSSDPDWDC